MQVGVIHLVLTTHALEQVSTPVAQYDIETRLQLAQWIGQADIYNFRLAPPENPGPYRPHSPYKVQKTDSSG